MGNLFGGGTSQNTTTTPNKEVLEFYKWMLGQGQALTGQGYPSYTAGAAADAAKNIPGLVAPMTPYQGTALQGIAGLQNYSKPYFDAATEYAGDVGTPVQLQQFNDAAVNKYMSPYLSNVVGAAVANINETNAQQQQKVLGNAITRGAFGGDRAKIAQAELARQQGLANNATIANLLNTGYGQALGQFNVQQTADIGAQIQNRAQAERAANLYGNLGAKGQEAQMQQLQAMYGAGGAQQQQRQAELSTAYQQYLNKYAYPYQQLSYFSGLLGGSAPNMGGTTSASIPQPSLGNQLIGSVGMLGSMGGTVPAGSNPMAYFGAGASSLGNAAGQAGNWLGSFFKDGGRVSRAEGGRTEYAPGGAVDPYQAYQDYTNLLATGTASLDELQAGYNAYLLAMQNASGSDSGSSSDGPYQITDGKKDTDTKPTKPKNEGNSDTEVVNENRNKDENQLFSSLSGGTDLRNVAVGTTSDLLMGKDRPTFNDSYTSSNGPVGGVIGQQVPGAKEGTLYSASGPYDNGGGPGLEFDRLNKGNDWNLGNLIGGGLGLVAGGPMAALTLGKLGGDFQRGYENSQNPSTVKSAYSASSVMGSDPAANMPSGTRTSNSPGVVIDYSDINSQYGLPSGYLEATRSVESGNGTNTYNSNSGAAGDFQFIPSTAKDYGPFNAYDPYQSADAAARLAKDNMSSLISAGIDPTGENIYGAHQQGATGYSNLVKNPNALASSIVGEKAVVQNGGNANMTAGEFAKLITSKFSNAGANLGSPMVTPAAKVDTPTGLVQNAGMKPLYDPTQGNAPPAQKLSDDNLTTSSIGKIGTVTSPVGGGGRNDGNRSYNDQSSPSGMGAGRGAERGDRSYNDQSSPSGLGAGRGAERGDRSYNDSDSSSGRGAGMAAERDLGGGDSMGGSSASNSWGGPRKSGGFVGHYADGGMAPIIMQYGLPTEDTLQSAAENFVGSGVEPAKGSIAAMAAKGVLPAAMGGRIHKQDAGAVSLLGIPSEPIPEDTRTEKPPLIDSQWFYDNILGPKFKEDKSSQAGSTTPNKPSSQSASSATLPVREFDPTSRAIGSRAERDVPIQKEIAPPMEDFGKISGLPPVVSEQNQPKKTEVIMPPSPSKGDAFGLSDPNRLAAFTAFARMAGTPGSFGYGLAAAADTYAKNLMDSTKTSAEADKAKAEAIRQRALAADESIKPGPRLTQVQFYDPDGNLVIKSIPIADMDAGANFKMSSTGDVENFGLGRTAFEKAKDFVTNGAIQKGVNDNAQDAYNENVKKDLSNWQYTGEANKAAFEKENAVAQAQGSAANQAKTDVNQMMHAITELGNTDTTSISAGGAGFKERQQFVNLFTYIGNTLGVPTDPETAANLTSGQVMRKTAAQWANKLSEGGNRPAASWMQEIASSLPDGEMTPQARAKVMAAIAVSNQMAIDYQKFAQQYGRDTAGAGRSVNTAFYETHPISAYQAEKNIYENVILDTRNKQNLFTAFQNELADPNKRNKAIQEFNNYIGVKNGTGLLNMSRYFI